MFRRTVGVARRTEAVESKTEASGNKNTTETTGSKTEAVGSNTEAAGSKSNNKTEATGNKTEPIASVPKTSKKKAGALPGVQTIEITAVKTRTAMVMTHMDDMCRIGFFVAPALLKRCDRFLVRRIRFCHSRAVSA